MWRFDLSRGTVEGEATAIAEGIGDAGVQRASFSVSAIRVLAHRAGGGQRRRPSGSIAWVGRWERSATPRTAPSASPELDAQGRQIAVFRQDQSGNNDVWLIDISRAVASRLTFDPGNDTSPLVA